LLSIRRKPPERKKKMDKDQKSPSAWDRLSGRFASLNRGTLAWGGLALAAVILLSINLISSISLRGVQDDMTQDKLFTISDGTREILRGIEEPIKVQVYFSKGIGEASPTYARYFERVKSLLDSFRDISGGKLQVAYLDPEPFSPEEDRAVAAGLRKVTYNGEGDAGYFGLTAVNSTDNQQTIEFFYPNRETFLEYDITKLIHTLANPKKTVVGVITDLPLDGQMDPRTQQSSPPWLIMQQMRELFDVRMLNEDFKTIPSDIDVLLIAQPRGLTPQAAYAIDQYVLGGGRALVLIDPVSETTQFQSLGRKKEGIDELAKILKSWGLSFDRTKVAADIAHAQRVRFGATGDTVTDYVAWLALDKSSIEKSDVLSAGIDTLNLASAGVLEPVKGATTKVTPIITTSDQAMEVALTDVGVRANPLQLLRDYKPGGTPLMLAARVSGEAKTAFPDGPPKVDKAAGAAKPDATEAKADADTKPTEKPLTSGKVNAIVIADTDLMADQFWVDRQQLMGQEIAVPTAQNAALIIGAIENLSGSDALIALRGRGVAERPFTLVQELQRDAERKFREKEQALTQKLTELQGKLAKLESSDKGQVILSDEEQKAANDFRAQMLKTRRELRDVKLALHRDIDRLDGWLKFTNIALVPLAIGIGGVGWSVWRTRTRKTKKKDDKTGSEDRS
jgi:gliding motility-associatede transport system auxiliary component